MPHRSAELLRDLAAKCRKVAAMNVAPKLASEMLSMAKQFDDDADEEELRAVKRRPTIRVSQR